MIETFGVTKYFDRLKALDNVTATIKEGSVFGLIGTNGAGKSTFLRILSGILKPDDGVVVINGKKVFENMEIKEKIFYISDEQFFFSNCTPEDMKNYYQLVYPKTFDEKRFYHMMKQFELDTKRKINTFSKGMKKQVSVICAVSAMTDYIFCDETFDGLDPVMRQAVKGLIASSVAEGKLVPIIASHNLRDLEDICDHVGVLHRGNMVLNMRLEEMQADIQKIQCAFQEQPQREWFDHLHPLDFKAQGRFCTLIVRAPEAEVLAAVQAHAPLFFETMPLSLEEIFIAQMGGIGYEIQNILV